MKLSIKWSKNKSKAYIGIDQFGNKYNYGALQETCSVELTDGRSGCGWTPEEAYQSAINQPLATENDPFCLPAPSQSGEPIYRRDRIVVQHKTAIPFEPGAFAYGDGRPVEESLYHVSDGTFHGWYVRGELRLIEN